jgi:hypothetical protein
VIAMVGKGCVAIACDTRLGNQALTVASNFEKVPLIYHRLTRPLTSDVYRSSPSPLMSTSACQVSLPTRSRCASSGRCCE